MVRHTSISSPNETIVRFWFCRTTSSAESAEHFPRQLELCESELTISGKHTNDPTNPHRHSTRICGILQTALLFPLSYTVLSLLLVVQVIIQYYNKTCTIHSRLSHHTTSPLLDHCILLLKNNMLPSSMRKDVSAPHDDTMKKLSWYVLVFLFLS